MRSMFTSDRVDADGVMLPPIGCGLSRCLASATRLDHVTGPGGSQAAAGTCPFVPQVGRSGLSRPAQSGEL